jgi:hypothetical protein
MFFFTKKITTKIGIQPIKSPFLLSFTDKDTANKYTLHFASNIYRSLIRTIIITLAFQFFLLSYFIVYGTIYKLNTTAPFLLSYIFLTVSIFP